MGRRVAPEHSADDLLAAFEALLTPKEGARRGWTTRELCARLKCGEDKVRKMLHALDDKGRLTVGYEPRKTFIGMRQVLVYSVKRMR